MRLDLAGGFRAGPVGFCQSQALQQVIEHDKKRPGGEKEAERW